MIPASGRRLLVTRRSVLGGAAAAIGLALAGPRAAPARAARVRRDDDGRPLTALERSHFPRVRVPVVVTNGAKVPIVVEMAHPMDPDHHIAAIEVVNARDPVPSKGTFELTPANGEVYLAFQARMHDGPAEVSVTAECTVHGRWTTVRPVRVLDGAGGCAVPAPASPARRAGSEPEVLPPRLRVPRLVAGGRIRPDEVVDVQLSMRHPNRTGLALRDGRFVAESEPFHLTGLEARYGTVRAGRFRLTSALGDDPLITFRLRAGRGGPLHVVLTNTRGQRFEALTEVRVS